MADSRDNPEEEQDPGLEKQEVVTRCKLAADIANRALETVVAACKPGARVVELCQLGDVFILEAVKDIYTKAKGIRGEKTVEKGIAFPTCVSVNHCLAHNSPPTDAPTVLQEGDYAKIDLGCHIDGFPAVVAHTIVVSEKTEDPALPKTAGPGSDVIVAAWTAREAALRVMKPGHTNTEVTAVVNKVAEEFGVTAVEGVLSHNLKRFIIDGSRVILQKPTLDQKVDEFTFEGNEVYALDICFSTGEGKPRQLEDRANIYKAELGKRYQLKLKTSRQVFYEISQRFSSFPFSLRAIDDLRGARMGVAECVSHGLLVPYPTLYEKAGTLVGHFKSTVFILPNGTTQATGSLALNVESEKRVQDEGILALLATSLTKKKKKKRTHKKGASAEKEADIQNDDDDDDAQEEKA